MLEGGTIIIHILNDIGHYCRSRGTGKAVLIV